MFCRKCGKEISSDVAFCRYCGANNPYYKADQSENQHARYCRKCGKLIQQDSEFCCYCGTKVAVHTNPENSFPKEDKAKDNAENAHRKKTWIWVFSAAIVLVVVGFVISGFISGNGNSPATAYSQTRATPTSIPSVRVWLDNNDGIDPYSYVRVAYGEEMPKKDAPSRRGYVFQGYYSSANGNGTQYYDSDMNSVHVWDKTTESTIYAHWSKVAEQKYSSLSKTGAAVYVDLVSFEPCVTVSKTMINGEREIIPSYLVCKCKTATGSTVYIYLPLKEYQQEIDSNADYVNLKLGRFETIKYSSKRTLHGYVQDAEKLCKGLSTQTGSTVIDVYQIDLF